jgi:hypothetical protein
MPLLHGRFACEVGTIARSAQSALCRRRHNAEYEGEDLYFAETVAVAGRRDEVDANVRVGRSPGKGNATALDTAWASEADPLLSEGLRTVRRQADHYFQRRDFTPWPRPADMAGFWDIFVPLQGLYLVLCTILERYTALVYGPAREPGSRLAKLRGEPDVIAALAAANPPALKVVDSRDPRTHYQVPGPKAFDAWYQVRSNLSHRGKAGFVDVDLIERSIVGLHDCLQALLDRQLGRARSPEWLRPIYDAARPDTRHIR